MSIAILEAATTYATKAHADLVAKNDRFLEGLARDNGNLAPTIDGNGRLHAPCDGYTFDDREYYAGEFMHVPENDFSILSDYRPERHTPQVRIKGNIEQFNEIRQTLKVFADVACGKSWDNGTCYYYIKSSRKALLTVMSDLDTPTNQDKTDKGIAPNDKATIRGRVACIKAVESMYGITTKCMVVLENKATVWGSVAKAISDVSVGSIVEFTATFEHAKDDNTHAFYKRPTKARVIAE